MIDHASYLRFAATVSGMSHDMQTQNGAVLVTEGADREIVVSWNGVPTPLRPLPERCYRPTKYTYIKHAERAVIYRAALDGVPTSGATLYCPWFACINCARAIVCAGIREVVGHAVARENTPDRWLYEIQKGEDLLREAGVGMRWLADPLGVSVLFDGRRIEL